MPTYEYECDACGHEFLGIDGELRLGVTHLGKKAIGSTGLNRDRADVFSSW